LPASPVQARPLGPPVSLETLIARHEARHRLESGQGLRLADPTTDRRPALMRLASALGGVPGDPEPVPIPGGLDIPGLGLFHVFVPGPEALGFQGEHYEPNVITNFQGFVAIAYLLGQAEGSDGKTYDMFNDMRVISGNYVSADGTTHRGTFAFI
jgi:hypothetical protein